MIRVYRYGVRVLREHEEPPEVRDGVAFVKVPAEHTTLMCSWCGHLNSYDAAPAVMVSCASCSRRYDQDENAARNLLARIVSAPAAGTGSARESRWGRIKRKKEEAPSDPNEGLKSYEVIREQRGNLIERMVYCKHCGAKPEEA